jgi:glycosyltransferase involved in cell wall biosynthesis
MKFILHSDIDANSIRASLGKPEYSYYFVLKAFLPVLEQMGEVTLVQRPQEEVDPLFQAAAAQGEDCVYISFSPPNTVVLDLECPTIVLVAWEFSTIPDGGWEGADPRDDWRFVFAKLGFGISLSSHTARVVKAAMGDDFPVFAISAPIYDRIPRPAPDAVPMGVIANREIRLRGAAVDSADYVLVPELVLDPAFPPLPAGAAAEPVVEELPPAEPMEDLQPAEAPRRAALRYRLAVTKRHILEWYREAIRDLLPGGVSRAVSRIGGLADALSRGLTGWQPPPPPPAPPSPPPTPPLPEVSVTLSGVVYTTMLNPTDGRKNWHDILTAFCWAFRDVEDATLVVKMVKGDPRAYRNDLFVILAKLGPFKCRVVTIDGFLEDADYAGLVAATSFYVNASNAEGLCMPLMEFMSAGKPVIAPCHTAMADYIHESAAFVLGTSPEHNVWPNDPRRLYLTMRERLHWDTLVSAFEQSYRVAKEAPERYAQMGASAANIMRLYCSDAVVREQLGAVMGRVVAAAAAKRAEARPLADAVAAEAQCVVESEPA